MKTRRSLLSRLIPSPGVRPALLLVSALLTGSAPAHAQRIFVADPNGTNGVRSYDINGTLINSSLIPGTTFEGLALSGSTLYVAEPRSGVVGTNNGKVNRYTLTVAGGVTSLNGFFLAFNFDYKPWGLAVTATNLFVATNSNVIKYNLSGTELSVMPVGFTNPYGLAVAGDILWVSQATTGTGADTIKGFSIASNSLTITITSASGLNLPHGLAVSGNTLYVANSGDGKILSFNATTGASNGAAVVSGLTSPNGVAVYGSSLFVTSGDGTIKGFDISAGYSALAGFTTVTGLSAPYGIVVHGIPEIDVTGLGVSIPDGAVLPLPTDDTDFGDVVWTGNASVTHTFTITNSGTDPLNVGLISTGSSEFVPTQPASPVVAGNGGTTTFTVTFNPSAPGVRTATVSIVNDDSNENPYDFAIKGNGVAPEIEVTGLGTVIVNNNLTPTALNDTYFGNFPLSGTQTAPHTFTIHNLGNAPLTVSSINKISGATTDFIVNALSQTLPATIAGGGTMTFDVTFDPSASGVRTAWLTVVNTDSDEGTYLFAVEGFATTPPHMTMTGTGSAILNGDLSAAGGNYTAFGSVAMCGTSVVHTYTIWNYGTETLNLIGTMPDLVVKGGANPGDFTVAQPSSTAILGGGGWLTFDVTFHPSGPGPRTATLSLANNDTNANPYIFGIAGNGTGPEIDVSGGSGNVSIVDGSPTPVATNGTAFGGVTVGSASTVHTFTITNTGTTPLNLTGTLPDLVVKGGLNSSDFTVVQPTASVIAANGGTATFTVTFHPSAAGLRTATISITNDDCNEGQYDFAIEGNGIAVGPGDVDPAFNPDANGLVYALAAQPDGKMVVGGYFTTMGGVARNYIARLKADGTLDTLFNPNANNGVNCAIVQADGKIVLGGQFITMGGVTRNNLARVNTDGTLDPGFDPNANVAVLGMALQADGKIVVAGYFTTVGGASRNRLARLNTNGTLDTVFNPNLNGNVNSVAVQADGKIVIGGAFSLVGGVARNFLARLNADGTLDSFNPNVNAVVDSVAVQADGKIVIGGNNFSTVGGVARNRLARLDAAGTLDPLFDPGALNAVESIVVQTDQKIVTAGAFTNTGGATRNYVARFDAAGTLEPGFNPNASSNVFAAAVQADGMIVIGGGFTSVGGVPRNRLARLLNDPITQSLTVPNASSVQWARSGASPETLQVTFELSTDGGTTWTPLGVGTRTTGGWNLTGLGLPGSGQIRARARTTSGIYNGSSGLVETIAAFSAPSAPQMIVRGLSVTIPDGDTTPTGGDDTAFGDVAVCGTTSTTHTFTIFNFGSAPLNLTGTSPNFVTVIGANPTEFAVTQPTLTVIPGGGSWTTFTVTFTPGGPGLRTATLNIANNDSTANPYDFALSGNGIAPEIDVSGAGQSIVDGDTTPSTVDQTAFGDVAVCGTASLTHTFTITNSGTAPLNLTGTPMVAISGANQSDFTMTQPVVSIIPGNNGTTTFTVTFNPSAAGPRTATLSIANNDCNEGIYDFAISGNGVAPQIVVQGLGTTILDGDTTPTIIDDTAFGNVTLCGTGTVTHTFTIYNTGTVPLQLTGLPLVAVSGANAGDFTVSQPTINVIPGGGGSTTFTVTFTPGGSGPRTATLSIANDDCNASPYDFAVIGNGVSPEIDVSGAGPSIVDGDTTPIATDQTAFGSVPLGSTSTVHTFTITNTGPAPLHLLGTAPNFVTVVGANAGDFSVVTQPTSSTIAANGGFTTFTVKFAPGAVGVRTATINIANDDCNEGLYDFVIQGNGTSAPEIEVQDGATLTPILNGDLLPSLGDNTDFGSSLVYGGAVGPHYFNIFNHGNAPLHVTSITSSNPAEFWVIGISQPLTATIMPGYEIFFSVFFYPTASGLRTGTITIVNDDSDESSYVFAVQGNGTGQPTIKVKGLGTTIVNGDILPTTTDDTDFGPVLWNGSAVAVHTFTITNSGVVPLSLTGTPDKVLVSGPNAIEFTVTPPTAGSIPVTGGVTFTVAFNPTGPGLRTAMLTIPNSDSNANPYVFAIQGTGQNVVVLNPNIQVYGNATLIGNGDTTPDVTDHTSFPDTPWLGGSTSVRTFTIANSGLAPLNVSGVTRSGGNAADFTLSGFTSGVVAPTSSATFNVTFNPSASGLRSTTISIGNNVPSANPYNFVVAGQGTWWVLPVPEIEVTGNNVNIIDGDLTPSPADHTNFGNAWVSGGTVVRTYTIHNLGLGALSVGSVAVLGGNALPGEFVVTQQPATSVASNGTTTFKIKFDPALAGTRTANLSFANGDASETPYNFAIRGTGKWWWSAGSGFSWSGTATKWVPLRDTLGGLNPFPGADTALGGTRGFFWGSNDFGQLGNNSTTASFVPVAVSTAELLAGKTIVDLAAGQNHSVALCSDGTLAAWGQGSAGQLGNGTMTDSLVPVAVTRTGALAGKFVVALAAGQFHTLALCSDGTVAAWGEGAAGQLGNTAMALNAVPVAVTATGALAGKTVVAIAAGDLHSVALCADGTVVTWGSNAYGQLGNGATPTSAVPVLASTTGVGSILGGKTIVAIAAGASHTLVACVDGAVAGWGRNHAGQLGDNSTTDRLSPVLVNASGVLAGKVVVVIAAGAAHNVAVCSDDTLVAWGENVSGQLGDGTTTNRAAPVAVNRAGVLAEKTVVALAAGAGHSVALTADGMLAAWGENTLGQLGTNDTANRAVPTAVNSGAIAAGGQFTRIIGGASATRTLALAAAPAPEIHIAVNSIALLSGGSPAGPTDQADFGRAVVNGGTAVRTFTISNPGEATLNLTGTPKVAVSGANAAEFTVNVQPASPVAALGGTTTFAVTFAPGAIGPRVATLTLATDDPNQNPYTLDLQGTGTTPGSLDPGLNPGANDLVFTTAVQPDGKNVLGGNFTAMGTATPNRAARIEADGSLDLNFNPDMNNGVSTTLVQADGAIVLGGSFTTVGGVARNYLARVDANGILDAGFNPNVDAAVFGLAMQPDGKFLIVGGFTTVGGVPRSRVARLNADGTLDAGFELNANRLIYTVAVQADGKILLGGQFSTVGGVTRNCLARVNANGTLDTGFDPDVNGEVTSMAIQPDGKIVIGGQFSTVGGVTRNRVARLNADGTLDANFDPNVDSAVYAMALQTDGKIVIGGAFTSVGGVERIRIARLNANGTPDTGFTSSTEDVVFSTAVQADGKIVIAGSFYTVGGVFSRSLARLDNDPATQSLTVPGASRVQWLRGGASPEAVHVTFEVSANGGGTWTMLGAGTRFAGGGWELTGLSLPVSGQIRARARTIGGAYSGSSGLVESIAAFGTATGAPEIEVRGGTNVIATGDPTPIPGDLTDFGSVAVGTGAFANHGFTIWNVGTADLLLTGTPKVTITGANAGDFTVSIVPVSPVTNNGLGVSLGIIFVPLGSGLRTATVTIPNNDNDEGTYTFAIQGNGTGTARGQIFVVDTNHSKLLKYNLDGTFANELAQYELSFPQGLALSGTTLYVADTNHNNIYRINVDGTGGGVLSNLGSISPYGIAASGNTLFVTDFNNGTVGAYNATTGAALSTFNAFPGLQNPAGIAVSKDGNTLYVTSVSLQKIGAYSAATGALNTEFGTSGFVTGLSGDPRGIAESGGSLFVANANNVGKYNATNGATINATFITLPTSGNANGIALSGSNLYVTDDTYQIVRAYTLSGAEVSFVQIPSGLLGPYGIAVQGNPEINVTGLGVTIPGGAVLPLTTDDTDFGNVVWTGNAFVTHTFTITNSGTDPLNVGLLSTGNPEFVPTQPASPVVAGNGGTTTFTVTFNPSASGVRTATVTIPNNDSDEGTYTFAIQGNGTATGAPEIEVRGGTNVIATGDTTPIPGDLTDFGSVAIGTGAFANHGFTIWNVGPTDLLLTGTPKVTITGANAGDFTVSIVPVSPVTNNGFGVSLGITFVPLGAGLRTATVTIPNNDSDEGTYTFAIQGNGLASTNTAPTITTHPVSQTVAAGANVSFTVIATGTPPFTYQWMKGNVAGSVAIFGATNATLMLNNAQAADAASYVVVVTNSQGSVTSAVAALTVVPVPVIATQPIALAVIAGSSATFPVAATNPGAGSLTYGWYFTPAGSLIPQALSDQAGKFSGTRTASLTISNVQTSDTGDYVCVISNSNGFTTSNSAPLIIVPRLVRVVDQTAAPGAQVVVPIQLLAAGDENAVTFGLQFNPAKLTYVGYALGADVAGGSVTPNLSQKDNGQLGFLIGKAPDTVHAAGTRTLITLTFTVAAGVPSDEVVPLTFADQPSVRRIFAVNGSQLPGGFADGRVTAILGLEGDINGDGEVDGGDWVKLGRIVVGLDPAPTSGLAFLRADIAPRATKGDGTVDGGDWVQLGRYVVGLDALQPAGGPSSLIP